MICLGMAYSGRALASQSGRGLPQSKTLARHSRLNRISTSLFPTTIFEAHDSDFAWSGGY
jgi:hypothetical protein